MPVGGRDRTVGETPPEEAIVATCSPGRTTTPESIMSLPDYDAQWYDGQRLAITAARADGAGTVVSMLDIGTGENPTFITLRGASGGVAFDRSGYLYIGNGYGAAGQTVTGTIKAFAKADWEAALKTGTPIDFDQSGAHVATLLSAAYLGFDPDANFHIGGYMQGGAYVAIARGDAIRKALSGGPPVTAEAPEGQLQRLTPAAGKDSWFVTSNPTTRELYLKAYDDPTVYIYVNEK